VVGQHVKVQDAATKLWRTGTIKSYHGGYLRHTGSVVLLLPVAAAAVTDTAAA
jgi:hypothetical protein